MKVALTTVSDDRIGRKGGKYAETQKKIRDYFEKNIDFGIKDFYFYNIEDIFKTEFYKQNKKIIDCSEPAFNGRCYKPYAIQQALNELDYGDILIYNDVSPEWWENIFLEPALDLNNYSLDIIKNLCIQNGGILTVEALWHVGGEQHPHTHEYYTLEVCMHRMGLTEFRHSLQHASGVVVLQKSEKSVNFVEDWLKYNVIDECCSLIQINDDGTYGKYYWVEEVELHGKFGHRHDQSISGLLINKMGNKLLKSTGNYNFLSYCQTNFNYQFIDSVKEPLPFYYKNTLIDGEWVPVLLSR